MTPVIAGGELFVLPLNQLVGEGVLARMNIKKIAKWILFIFIFILVSSVILGLLFGVEEEAKPVTTSSGNQQHAQGEIKKVTDIDSAVQAWTTSGLSVTNENEPFYQLVGATAGMKYDVGETNVELYEYEDAAKANDAKDSNFNDDSKTVFVVDTLLVLIHSKDSSVVNRIKAVF